MFGILYALITIAAAILLCVIGYQIHNIATKIFHGDGIGVGKIVIVGLIILAIFAVAALSPAGSRAESSSSWYKATVTNAVDEEYEGETAYLVTFVTEAGTVYSYYDDSKLPEGTEIEARIDDNGKVLDAVTKAETETQMIIVYVLIGILILCIVISIADGTF